MIVIGIDPGIKGALAIFDEDCQGYCIIFDMPIVTIKRGTKAKSRIAIGDLITELNDRGLGYEGVDCHAFIEIAHNMPGQGASSAFTIGRNYQAVLDAVSFAGVPLTEVSSVKWKKALQVPAEKDGARFRASQLLPQYATQWPLKKHDGRAEAALIALYGQRELNKMQGKS